MTRRNMSDIIEEYLKQFLQESQRLEIKRSDIADRFDCVPSQINYVINTRFTQEHGYLVESKPVSYTHLTLPTTLHECRSRWSPYH